MRKIFGKHGGAIKAEARVSRFTMCSISTTKSLIMKAILAVMVIAAAADFLSATVELHHEAILPYLEAEDQALVKKLNDPAAFDHPTIRPSRGPSVLPTGLPGRRLLRCKEKAQLCHKRAEDDACLHLCCVYATGKCIKETVKIDPAHIPPKVKFCGVLTGICMKHSPSCEEKLCCVVRFAECVGILGEKP